MMDVVVAIIIDNQQKILITRRALDKSHGGYWEFPGGKVDAPEEAIDALKREIKEEVGIEVIHSKYLGEVKHSYHEKHINLIIYLVVNFTGTAQCQETQLDLRWVHFNELSQYEFPEANYAIINLLKDHFTSTSNYSNHSH